MPAIIRGRRVVIVALTVVVVAAVASGFWVLSRDTASQKEESDALTSYEFEARRKIEAGLDSPDALPPDTIRGYGEKDRWRWEFSNSDPARVEEGNVQVSDGKTVWWYDRPTNLYYREDLEEYQGLQPPELGEGPSSLFFILLIGPVPPSEASALAASDPIGHEAVAGRSARILRFTQGDPGRETTTTLWLDEEFPFVLKFTASDAAGNTAASAETVSVSFNGRLKDDLFRFKAQAGAKEVQAPRGESDPSGTGCLSLGSAPIFRNSVCSTSWTQAGLGQQVNLPPGFLQPRSLPAGFNTRETSTTGRDFGPTFVRLRFENDAGSYLVLEQQMRAGGLAESHKQGRKVDVAGGAGYEMDAGDERRLVWAQGDMVLKLLSDVLPLQELLRIAESVR